MNEPGIFSNGARLVWRHQRIVWWIFALSFALGVFASMPARMAMSDLLGHSMSSSALINGFDWRVAIEAMRQPQFNTAAFRMAALGYVFVYFVFLVFINGGVLSVYREDRKLTKAEFFEMSGAYFWRMVRLMLWSIIPFTAVAVVSSILSTAADSLSDRLANSRIGGWASIIVMIIIWLLVIFVRAWFDIAQSKTVAQNERSTWRKAVESFVAVIRSRVYPVYVLIHITGALVSVALLALWLYLPHQRTVVAFILIELVILVHIFARLWQRAASMTWVEAQPLPVPVSAYTPEPVFAGPEPVFPETLPPTDTPASPPPEV